MELDDLGYEYPPDLVGDGAILANEAITAFLDSQGNLRRAWSASDGLTFCGELSYQFTILRETQGRIVPEPLETIATRFFPGHQERILGTEGLILTLRTFVPIDTGFASTIGWLLEVQSEGPHLLQVEIDANFIAEDVGPAEARRVQLTLDRAQVVATSDPVTVPRFGLTLGSSNEIRILGTPSGPPDQAELSHPARARLLYRILIEGTVQMPFLLAYSPAGDQMAWSGWLAMIDLERFFEQSQRQLQAHLHIAAITTPDPAVNQALAWASAIARRAQQTIAAGPAVPHTPASTTLSVANACWHAIAVDTFDPAFAGALLQRLAHHTTTPNTESGPHGIAPFYAPLTNTLDLDGPSLTIATPLFVIACAHHWHATHDHAWLAHVAPAIHHAVDALLDARDSAGLIAVESPGIGVAGLPGWRNTIPGERLTGVITELNVLAAFALHTAAALPLPPPPSLGTPPASDAPLTEASQGQPTSWGHAAHTLTTAILTHLRRPGGELLLLARPPDGEPRTELSGDMVFTLLAGGLGDARLTTLLLNRLTSPYQWSDGGALTLGHDQPGAHPAAAQGLLGGISTLLTAWFGVATGQPTRALQALSALHRPTHPAAQQLIPGQLPATLHRHTLERLGPAWHPLAAPLLRWLAVEGLLGFVWGHLLPFTAPTTPDPHDSPTMWPWFLASRIPWQGSFFSAALIDGILHTDRDLPPVRLPFLTPEAHERWATIEPIPNAPRPALVLRRGGDVALIVATPNRPFVGTITVDGIPWTVELSAGEAHLLRQRPHTSPDPERHHG